VVYFETPLPTSPPVNSSTIQDVHFPGVFRASKIKGKVQEFSDVENPNK